MVSACNKFLKKIFWWLRFLGKMYEIHENYTRLKIVGVKKNNLWIQIGSHTDWREWMLNEFDKNQLQKLKKLQMFYSRIVFFYFLSGLSYIFILKIKYYFIFKHRT